MPCALQQYATTWLICTPLPLTSFNVTASLVMNDLFLSLWDPSALVVARSLVTYSYPIVPVIFSVSGCGPPSNDTSSGVPQFVWTSDCPTLGNVTITLSGQFFAPLFSVSVNSKYPCVDPVTLLTTITITDPTTAECILPQATGTTLPLQITSGGYVIQFPSAVSYLLPNVTNVTGCNQSIDPAHPGVVECNREGKDVITIMGTQFGSGGARVIVGGQSCYVRSSTESKITCELQKGRTLYNEIIVLQSTGGMTIVDTLSLSVSYHQCLPGTYENPLSLDHLDCLLCGAATFSPVAVPFLAPPAHAQSSLTSCLNCPVGTTALSAGTSACTDCTPGRFWNGTNQCAICPAGTFTAKPASVSCSICDAGSFNANPNQFTCTKCPAGRTHYSATTCQDCAPGTVSKDSGTLSCTGCDFGFYQSNYGQTACVVCPRFSTSSSGQPTCACNSGYFFLSGECLPCPQGAECSASNDPRRDVDTLSSVTGFWRLVDPVVPRAATNATLVRVASPPLFYRCPYGSIACPPSNNGSCVLGYSGVKCGVCAPGFHDTGTACIPCVGATQYMLPIVAVCALVVCLIGYWVAQRYDTRNLMNASKILIAYLQGMLAAVETHCLVLCFSCWFVSFVLPFPLSLAFLSALDASSDGQFIVELQVRVFPWAVCQ